MVGKWGHPEGSLTTLTFSLINYMTMLWQVWPVWGQLSHNQGWMWLKLGSKPDLAYVLAS